LATAEVFAYGPRCFGPERKMVKTRSRGFPQYGVSLIAAIAVLAPRAAHADFQLVTPTPWIVEDPNGDPQTMGPCGVDTSVCYTPSGAVTTYIAGTQITLAWVEKEPVDGWYRVALSYNNRTDIGDPAVSVDDAGLSSDASNVGDPNLDADVGINAALPILADGLFPYPVTGPHTPGWMFMYHVTLPNMPCEKCTLQVIQYLNNHSNNLANGNPSGYFAHHCADIRIASDTDPLAVPGTVTTVDAGGPSPACSQPQADASAGGESSPEAGGSGPRGDAGADASIADASVDGADATTGGGAASGSGGGGGCGCVAAGGEGAAAAGAGSFAAFALLVIGRRRTRPRARVRSRWRR
jgi:hypothetical protein